MRSSHAAAASALLLACACAALGVWQLERRAAKLDLLARVAARIHAPPAPAPGPGEWPRVEAARDEYRRVRLVGRYLSDRETLVQAATRLGAGYWVMTPLFAADGATVLVNRGFVPAELREAARRRAAGADAPGGEVSVTGLLRLSEPRGTWLRANDPPAERWVSRDVAAIAVARGLGPIAPYFVDADAVVAPAPVSGAASDPAWPAGGLTVVDFPNNHLEYALTWFALAGMAIGAFAVIRRAAPASAAERA